MRQMMHRNQASVKDHSRTTTTAQPAAPSAILQSERIVTQRQTLANTFVSPFAGDDPGADPSSLPRSLAAGIRSLSGMNVADVRVHQNSAKPAQMGAHAFAQGRDIHIAPRQEKHLPHEAWHVVQQRQGRVATSRHEKGVSLNDDPTLEREATVMGDRAVRMPELPADEPSPSTTTNHSGAMQRVGVVQCVALDVAGVAGGAFANFTWSYMKKLMEEHKMAEEIKALLQQGCVYLADEAIKMTGVFDVLTPYLDLVKPYVATLEAIAKVIESIPKAVQVVLAYGIGWCIRRFADLCGLGTWLADANITGILSGTGEFAEKIGKVIHVLNDFVHKPPKMMLSGISWAYEKGKNWWNFKADQRSAENTPPATDDAKQSNEMVDANIGWFWLNVDNPKLYQENKGGGMEVDGRVGIKVFGNVMGADAGRVRVSYSGAMEGEFKDVSLISGTIGLGNLFKGGPISLPMVKINQKGLEYASLLIKNFNFGDGIFTNTTLEMSYDARAQSKELSFFGDTVLNAFDHKIKGKFDLRMSTDGKFLGGGVELECPEKFALLGDRLFLANPKLWAKWTEDGGTDIGIGGDLGLKLIGDLEFDSTGTTIRYKTGEGLVGEVKEASLNIPLHEGSILRFEVTRLRIDKNGFSAENVALIYAYGDKEIASNEKEGEGKDKSLPEPGSKFDPSKISQMVPGFDLDWIKATGLETLIVRLSADNVSIGHKGIDIAALKKEITRFRARIFGISADFDGIKKTGMLEGKMGERKIGLPKLEIKVPVIPPGIMLSFGMSSEVGFHGDLGAKLTRGNADEKKPHIYPWNMEGKAILMARAAIRFDIGVAAGIPYLAELSAGAFALAEARAQAMAEVRGTVLWDEKKHRLSMPTEAKDKPTAELTMEAKVTAEIGAQIRAKIFYFFDKELASYRFAAWELGKWVLKGKLVAKEGGGYELVNVKSGFGDDLGRPNAPKVIKAPASALEVIEKSKKIEDMRQVWRIVHDLEEPGAQLSDAKKHELYEKLEKKTDRALIGLVYNQVIAHFDTRSDYNGLSFLMTKAEWIKYSETAHRMIHTQTDRKNIKPIDEAIEKYHKETSLEKRKAILHEFIDKLIPGYIKSRFLKKGSRVPMCDKLATDAARELARISGPGEQPAPSAGLNQV